MKKSILSLLSLASISIACAQQTQTMTFSMDQGGMQMNSSMVAPKEVLDTALVEFTYNYSFMSDTTTAKMHDNGLWVLQVGGEVSKFSCVRQMQIDSLLAVSSPQEVLSNVAGFKGGNHVAYFKNHPTGQFTTIDKLGMQWVSVEEQIQTPLWQLESESKEILGYSSRKARAQFQGREWVVWYTDEIAVSAGPWKLDGLPGLVVEACDSQGHYLFSLVGVKNSNNSPLTIPETRFSKTSIEKYHKSKRENIENPLAALSGGTTTLKIMDQDGNAVNEADLIKPMKYDFIAR